MSTRRLIEDGEFIEAERITKRRGGMSCARFMMGLHYPPDLVVGDLILDGRYQLAEALVHGRRSGRKLSCAMFLSRLKKPRPVASMTDWLLWLQRASNSYNNFGRVGRHVPRTEPAP